jgi:hypothetical protein
VLSKYRIGSGFGAAKNGYRLCIHKMCPIQQTKIEILNL